MKIKQLFICDPFESLKVEKDTSLLLMQAALKRNHQVFFAEASQISLIRNKVFITFKSIEYHSNKVIVGDDYRIENSDFFDYIWIRKDPPFNAAYLDLTWILDFVSSTTKVINSPKGLRQANEKIWALNFSEYMPKTILTQSTDIIAKCFSVDEEIVLKPTDLFGGQGIIKTKQSESDFRKHLESLSQNFRRPIMVQQFLPEAIKGDKRILLWRGEIIGAVLRKNSAHFINNFFAGGTAVACGITANERNIIQQIKPALLNLGLDFVGLDFLGNYLTEINVTSPTCLVEIKHFAKKDLESIIFDDLEKSLAR